jgi:uncharacterized protein YidB (DUF937 family)
MGLFDNAVPGGSLAKPVGIALLALLAYRAFHGRDNAGANPGREPGGSGGGSLGGLLGGLFGGGADQAGSPQQARQAEQAGSEIPAGLNGLVERFRQGGFGGLIDSWIGTGANQPVAPRQLGQALEPNEIDELARRTGLSREQVLDELARALPTVVDRLTPQGRIPQRAELSHGYQRPG